MGLSFCLPSSDLPLQAMGLSFGFATVGHGYELRILLWQAYFVWQPSLLARATFTVLDMYFSVSNSHRPYTAFFFRDASLPSPMRSYSMILVWSLTFSVVPVTVPVTIASSPVYGPSVNVNQSPLFKSMTAQLVNAEYGSSPV